MNKKKYRYDDFRHFDTRKEAFARCQHKKTWGCQGMESKVRSDTILFFVYIEIFDISIFFLFLSIFHPVDYLGPSSLLLPFLLRVTTVNRAKYW